MPDKKYLYEYIPRYLDVELASVKNMTASGYKNYSLTLKMLLAYMSERKNCKSTKIRSSELTYNLVSDFMNDMRINRSWKERTWNTRLSGVKSLLQFLSLEDLWFSECYGRVRQIKSQRVPRKDPFYLCSEIITTIINDCSPRNWIEYRDYTLVQFMVATGLRVQEVCNLQRSDIKWLSSHRAHVSFIGKGRKHRVIPVTDAPVIRCLKRFLGMPDVNSEYVFPGKSGAKMSTSNLGARISQFFSLHIKVQKVTPHVLRRSAAMKWLSGGMDVFHVSAMLGHERIETTEKYVRSNLEDREAQLRKSMSMQADYEPFVLDQEQDDFLEKIMMRIRKKVEG